MQYDALAPVYDRIMSFVAYDEWIDLTDRVVNKYLNVSPRENAPRVLELGAGTGVAGERLRDMGYDYIASDLSFGMCKVARDARALPICVADARRLPFKKQFDLALFLYDGINYLLTLDDYAKLFASVYDVLTPGGLFLFDVTTRHNSLTHFENFLDFEDYGFCSYARHSYFDKQASVQHNDFTIYHAVSGESLCDDDVSLYKKYVERHRQKIFSVKEIERAIPRGRFETVGVWDEYTFRRHTSKSIRIHFLLRKISP